jgi:hypothetical protein
VIKLMCTGTISKQKIIVLSGWENRLRDQNKDVRVDKKLLIFFMGRATFIMSFFPRCQTDNRQFYLEVMKRLREVERRKRPDRWKNKTWMLHHDDAPANTSLLVREFLAKNETTVVPQPPYSPDFSPADFFHSWNWNPLWKVVDFRQ